MTGSSMKRWREAEAVELNSKRHRRETSKLNTPLGESMGEAKGIDDALGYLRKVKEIFKAEGKYVEFLEILRDFRHEKADIAQVALSVKNLFKGYPALAHDFNAFLPRAHKIVYPAAEERLHRAEEETPLPQKRAAAEEHRKEVAQQKKGLDLQNALSFVHKVKQRFLDRSDVYECFLGVLSLFKQRRDLRELTVRVQTLFSEHADLMEEFSNYLPMSQRPSALRPTIQANSGSDHSHNRSACVRRIQEEAGLRATSPIDLDQVETSTDDMTPLSSPKIKKQLTLTDMDADENFVPEDSPSKVKWQLKLPVKDDEEEDGPEHSRTKVKEQLKKAVEGEKEDDVSKQHSPPNVKTQRKLSDNDEEDVPEHSRPNVKEHRNRTVGVEREDVASKLSPPKVRKKWKHSHSNVNEQPMRTVEDEKEDVSEQSPHRLRNQRKTTAEDEEQTYHVSEDSTTWQRKQTEDDKGGVPQYSPPKVLEQHERDVVVGMEDVTPDHSPPKIIKEWEKTPEDEEQSNETDHLVNAISAMEVLEQADAGASQELQGERCSPTTKLTFTKTDGDVQWHGREKDTIAHVGSKESLKEIREQQKDACASQKSHLEHSPLKFKRRWQKLKKDEEWLDAKDLSGCASHLERSPLKFKRRWKKLKKDEELLDAKDLRGCKEYSKEEGEHEVDVPASRTFHLEQAPPEVKKKKKNAIKVEKENSGESKDSVMEVWQQLDVDASDEYVLPRIRKEVMKIDKNEEEDAVREYSPLNVESQETKTAEESEEIARTDSSESEESKEFLEKTAVDTSKLPQKRSSARLAGELIRRQCQAAEAGLAIVAPLSSIVSEENQQRMRLQQLEEDKKSLLVQKRQLRFFDKVKKTLQGSLNSTGLLECLQTFARKMMSCPQLRTVVAEVLEEQELEYSQCKRCTPSYYQLPTSYLKPLSIRRTDSIQKLLNDNWVSVGYDDESKQNALDEGGGTRKQIGRDGASKRAPHDKRLFHEERLLLCEDDQYELDLLRETTANTIQRVVNMVKLVQASDFQMHSFNWDEHLTPVNVRCIERIYGDYGVDFVEQARANPIDALPVILRRLKDKEDHEWPEYQMKMNKLWAEVHLEHHHLSQDYGQSFGKENDNMQLFTDSLQVKPNIQEDQSEHHKLVTNADGEPEELTPELSFEHPDVENTYQVIKYLLKEVRMTEEQFKKMQGVWSMHVNAVIGIPADADEEPDTGELTTM